MSMRTIFKYTLDPRISAPQAIPMPLDAKIRHVHMQHGRVTIWAEVDTQNEIQNRRFCIHGTGHPINRIEAKYAGTVMDDPYVWHIFEVYE
jgi:hypothetical protein